MNNYEIKGYLIRDDKKIGICFPILAKSIQSAYSLAFNYIQDPIIDDGRACKDKIVIVSIKQIEDKLELKIWK